MHTVYRSHRGQFPTPAALGEVCYDSDNGSYYMATGAGSGGTMWTLLKDSFDVENAKAKVEAATRDDTKPDQELIKELRYKVLYKETDFSKNYKLEDYIERHEARYEQLPTPQEVTELESLLDNPNVFLIKQPNAMITYTEGEQILSVPITTNVYNGAGALSQKEISSSKYSYFIFLYSHEQTRWTAKNINPTNIISIE